MSAPAPYGFELVPEHPTLDGWREAARSGNWHLTPATDGSFQAVQRIFERLAGGITLHALARELTEIGAPLPCGSGAWIPGRIARIARKPIYAENLQVKRAGYGGEVLTFPGWHTDPPVTREIFEQVQQRLRRHRA